MTIPDQSVSRRADDRIGAMFLVVGRVNGRSRTVAVGSPAEGLAEIVRWCDVDPDASGRWLLSPTAAEPVTLIARRRFGLVGESRRVSHLFELLPGVPQGFRLEARCGSPLPITELEWLDLHGHAGMPCMGCLRALAVSLPQLDDDYPDDYVDDYAESIDDYSPVAIKPFQPAAIGQRANQRAMAEADEVMPAAMHARIIQSIWG